MNTEKKLLPNLVRLESPKRRCELCFAVCATVAPPEPLTECLGFLSVAVETKEQVTLEVSAGESAAPFFMKKPAAQKLVEGGSVVFECQVGGNPKPHVIWKKNGLPLTTGYR